jgi:rare lipoprotein A (peptidoglycan hydrolase)
LESAQEWANAQRALNNPPDFSTVTNPETGIFEPNPRAAEDQARWESERQADIDRANKRGEEFAGLRERSAETQNFIDAKTGNQNPLLTAYQTYIGGLKSIAGLNLETPLTYAASQFTSDQQLIDGYGSLGSQMAAPLAPMVGLGAGAGEQFLGAIGEPLADTQLSNLYKADDALAIQRTLDIGATALNAVGFAPESMLAKAGSLFSAERIGADIASDLGSAVAAESRLSRMENQLGELNASYERALSRVGTDAAPTSGELAAMRNEISAVESNVARLRGTESGTSPIAAADVSPAPVVPQEVRALTYGDAAPTAVSTAETSAAARAFVTGNDTTELGGAISRAADAGAIERAGIAEVNGQRYLYEAPVGEGAVLTPIRDLSVSDLAPMSAKELNAIADAKGVSPVVSEPTVLRNAVTDVTPAERTAISRLENAGKDLAEWRAVPDGRPSPVSRVLAAEQALDEIGVSQSLDGTLYRSNSGEILGRLETAETPGRLLGRADAELPRYTKAGDEWFESSNLSRPITNSDIISALEAKLPTNSVSAAQVAADSQWAKGVASFEAKQAEVARAARAAEERAAREAAEKAAEKNPPAVSRTPTKAPTETVPRLDNSPEVIADLRRLEAAADRQALSENGRILSGPTSQSLQDGMNAFKAAGGVPEDIKFARAYLDKDAVYRVTPEGNLSRITNSEIAESVRSAQNPLVRTAEAESIARVAQNIASEKEAAEALKAQIAAAKVYDGEIMVAQDVREAGRAIAGDVDALARQGARDARQFTWSPEAQLPQTLAEATGGKAFLSEVEAALENPFHAPTTNFSRGSGNVSSDGLAAAREPYRAPQNTFTEAQAAVRERLGGSTPPETIAQRASLTETRVAPSPKTVVHDLAEAANDIPLVEVKNVPGTQLGDALTVPEATAIHSFNSALANYTKLAESGGDISRAATQVSNAFAELAEVGITQRATDGALARDTGEVVAVRVSPPMAAQATYAVVVPVDPQVREFATGSTDETFSFEAPDLRILSSDFGVEPPINTDEAITLKKANDILENTRSRDALENLFKKSDLSVRPQDGFIVRNNGEIVARPEGTGSLPGALPERYVPAGPMPALPLKLQQNQKFTMPNGTVIERFKATDYNGKTVADVSVTIDGTKAVVDKIQANTLGRTDWDAFRNVLGPSQIRSLLRQFRETHPEIVSIGGIRMSGARFAGEWDPANTGEVMELILPTIPAEPVPISIPSRSTIPTALALSVALTVASPIPMDAISNAFNGAANVFSTAAQAAPKPTARDIERHGNAVADIGQVKKGVASWYGTGSNGGTNPSDLTASGAWHTNSDYTVAMLGLGPKYAWGTRLLVKNVQEFLKDGSPNPAFGKEVEVVVTSTGGQPNRSLDLSPAARDALGIGADGTALVEFTVVSVPDIMDSIYKKGRTDLTGGSPVPKGTFNTKIAQLKQDPKLAIAQAGALSNPTVVGANAQNPVNSALDAAAKVFGDILKGSKTANDKAVDLASNLQRVNPNISAIDIAARLADRAASGRRCGQVGYPGRPPCAALRQWRHRGLPSRCAVVRRRWWQGLLRSLQAWFHSLNEVQG